MNCDLQPQPHTSKAYVTAYFKLCNTPHMGSPWPTADQQLNSHKKTTVQVTE